MTQSRERNLRRWAIEAALAAMPVLLLVFAWRTDPAWIERHMSSLRCIENPRTLTAWTAARITACVLAAVFVLVLRPRLRPRVLASEGLAAATGRYVVMVVLALLCAELYLRRPGPPYLAPEGYSPQHMPDPVFAWRLAPAAQHTWHAGGRQFLYAVNDEGNRARSIHDDSRHDEPTILIGGESIAMGMGNAYEDGFAARLENDTGIQVVDLGVDAYGLDQTYMREAEVLPSYSHPIAIVTVFHPEMAERAEVEDRPRLRVDDHGALRLVPPTPLWIREIQLRRILRGLYHSSSELEDLRALVRATADLARSRGAYPLFLTLNFSDPCLDVEGRGPYLFRSLIDEQGVPRVHVAISQSERLSDDQHPGPAAHERIAQAVEKALRDAQVIDMTR